MLKKTLFAILVVLMSGALTAILLEVVSRVVFSDPQQFMTRLEFRRTRPKPYEHSPYYSEAFMEEYERHALPPWKWDKENSALVLGDLKGTYYNVQNGYRATTGTPKSYQSRVFLSGGSTIYNEEVPDGFTVASYLQECLNQRSPDRYKVINDSIVAQTTEGQIGRLHLDQIQPGDTVIFYAGFNDLYYSVFEPRASDELITVPSYPPKVLTFSLAHKDQLSVFRALLFILTTIAPAVDSDPQLRERELNAFAEKYVDRIQDAWRFTLNHKARFFHFLQGTIYQKARLTEYENHLLKNHVQIPYKLGRLIVEGFPKVDTLARQSAWRETHFNLSHIFDQETANDVFLDFCHVNEVGNKLIADRICEAL